MMNSISELRVGGGEMKTVTSARGQVFIFSSLFFYLLLLTLIVQFFPSNSLSSFPFFPLSMIPPPPALFLRISH